MRTNSLWSGLCLLALLSPAAARADARADFAQAEKSIEGGEVLEAKRLFAQVMNSPRATPSLRGQAALHLGCMSLEFDHSAAGRDLGQAYFAKAFRFDPRAPPVAGWNPACDAEYPTAKTQAELDRQRLELQRRALADAEDRKRRAEEEKARAEQQLAESRKQAEDDRARREAEEAKKPKAQRQPQIIVAVTPQSTRYEDELRKKSAELAAAEARVKAAEEDTRRNQTEADKRDQRFAAMLQRMEEMQEELFKAQHKERTLVPTLVLGGLALGTLGGGTYFGLQARSARTQFDATPFQAEATTLAATGQRSQLTANVLFGSAAVLALTSAIVYFVQDAPPPRKDATPVAP